MENVKPEKVAKKNEVFNIEWHSGYLLLKTLLQISFQSQIVVSLREAIIFFILEYC